MEENFSMEWNIFSMEWKEIASMEYGKIVFHSIPRNLQWGWLYRNLKTTSNDLDPDFDRSST